jgi:peptide subunit release factor 1 (eRF1)
MPDEETIVLECPYCQAELARPMNWFKQTYFTCPACGGGLAAGQFAALIDELEQALEESTARMLKGDEPGCGCGGGGCGGRHV